jgi:uncharacterized SAM-binding protein YcdF (DUF218 family)
MFFFLSKTLGYLVRPLVFVCLLFLVSWLVKKPRLKRVLRIAGLFLLFFFSNEFIVNEVINGWEIKATPFAQMQPYSYGILLTGTTHSGVGPADRVYVATGADRINHSLQLYKLGLIRKLVISGGSGLIMDSGTREANHLAELLVLMGMPREDILIENESRNTHESAVNVPKLLQSRTRPSDCLLITSASHMRRSLACFKKEGWACTPFPTDFHGHSRQYAFDVLFIPKLEAFKWWETLFKEWTGYLTYWMVGYI